MFGKKRRALEAAKKEGVEQGRLEASTEIRRHLEAEAKRREAEREKQEAEQEKQTVTLQLGMGFNIGGVQFAIAGIRHEGRVMLRPDLRDGTRKVVMGANCVHYVPNVGSASAKATADESASSNDDTKSASAEATADKA